jgi:hypothetical protein
VPALDGAVALAEREHRAVRVGQELDLDVPRAFQVALEEDRVVAEGGLGLAARCGQGVLELVGTPDDPHPSAAAAGRRLDEQRVAELLGRALGHDGDAGLACDALRGQLVAAHAEGFRGRPDPRQSGGHDRLGEGRALGEEAVAGVDRVGAGLARRAHVLGGVEVRGDLNCLLGAAGVQRAPVVGRGDGDGRDPELAAFAEDAQRDLATVGDEQLLHGRGS